MARTGRPPQPALDRFMRQTCLDGESGCIEWTGHRDVDGYGQFRPGGRETSNVRAHRWAYEHHVGPIPDGHVIDHLCRNRACVNPDHMEAVTPRENTLRGHGPAAENSRKTHCKRGHEFTPENTYRAGTRGRACKACVTAASAINYRNRKALA